MVSRWVIALLFSLDNWWEVRSLQRGVSREPNFLEPAPKNSISFAASPTAAVACTPNLRTRIGVMREPPAHSSQSDEHADNKAGHD
jgi:hypothetical protein